MLLGGWVREWFLWFGLHVSIVIIEIELEKALAKLAFYQIKDFFVSVGMLVEVWVDDRALGSSLLGCGLVSFLLVLRRMLSMLLSSIFFSEVVFLEVFWSFVSIQSLIVSHLLLTTDLSGVLEVSFFSSQPGLAVVVSLFLLLRLLHEDLNIFHAVVYLDDDPFGQSSNGFSSVGVVGEVIELFEGFDDEEVLVHVLDEASIAVLHDVLGQLQCLHY